MVYRLKIILGKMQVCVVEWYWAKLFIKYQSLLNEWVINVYWNPLAHLSKLHGSYLGFQWTDWQIHRSVMQILRFWFLFDTVNRDILALVYFGGFLLKKCKFNFGMFNFGAFRMTSVLILRLNLTIFYYSKTNLTLPVSHLLPGKTKGQFNIPIHWYIYILAA